MMLKLTSLLPKKWIFIGGTLLAISLLTGAYYKGASSERLKWKLKVEQQINQQVAFRLEELNSQLDAAVALRDAREGIIRSQEHKLNEARAASESLQESLNNVLNNPSTECTSLPDAEYRLYQDYLSQERQ